MEKRLECYLEIILIVLVYLILVLFSKYIFLNTVGINSFIEKGINTTAEALKIGSVMAISQIIVNLIIGIGLIYLFRKRKGLISEIKLNKKYDLSKLKFIITASLGALFIGLILSVLEVAVHLIALPKVNITAYETGNIYGIIVLIIMIPAIQEVIFRGIIFNKLRERLNIKIALIIQALLFSLLFITTEKALMMFVLGLIFGIIYIYSDSLWGAISGHMILSVISIVDAENIIYASKFPILHSIWDKFYILILIISLIWAIKIYRKKKIGELIFGEKIIKNIEGKEKIEKKFRKRESRKFKLIIMSIIIGTVVAVWLLGEIGNVYTVIKEAENNSNIMAIIENKRLNFNEKLVKMNEICKEEGLNNQLSKVIESVGPDNKHIRNVGTINGQAISKQGINKDIFLNTEYKGISNLITYKNSGNLDVTTEEKGDIIIRYYNPNILTKETLVKYYNEVIEKGTKGYHYILVNVYDDMYIMFFNARNNKFVTGNTNEYYMMLGNNNLMNNTIETDGKIVSISYKTDKKGLFILKN